MIFYPKYHSVESVTSGHPDKVCDQISDAVLDACLAQDPKSRVAIEVMGSHGLLLVAGEVTTKAKVDYEKIARKVSLEIGYKEKLEVIVHVGHQSPDIAIGVDTGGAGDQGIMYGFATDETPEYLPTGIALVHKLARELETLRKSGKLSWLRPDGKTLVTLKGKEVKNVLVSTQHDKKATLPEIKKALIKHLIKPLVGDLSEEHIFVNPTGHFVVGGFAADSGLTGRKIMVDTYGGLIPHGGGCFSGKDPTKVDRSAAYMCRFAAKNLVVNGFAKKALVSVAYAIGRAEPLMVEAMDENGKSLDKIVNKYFDFRPLAIIERLNLRRPMYQQAAAYGHFGKSGFPWEETIKL